MSLARGARRYVKSVEAEVTHRSVPLLVNSRSSVGRAAGSVADNHSGRLPECLGYKDVDEAEYRPNTQRKNAHNGLSLNRDVVRSASSSLAVGSPHD